MDGSNRTFRGAKKQRMALGLLSIFLVLVMVAAACGEAATPTPAPPTSAPPTAVPATAVPPTSEPDTSEPDTSEPATAMPEPEATTAPAPAATATPQPPTAVPEPEITLRPISEWTPENPATLEEIEGELEKYRGETVIFRSEGGALSAAYRRAWLNPLREQFGLNIVEDTPSPGVAGVRINAETENIQWHILDIGAANAAALIKTDSLGEHDPAVVDTRDFLSILTEPGPYLAGGGVTWSLVLAYNTDVYPGDTGPKNWADFFDREKFPGRRALYQNVNYGGQLQIQRLAQEPDLLDTPEGKRELATPSREQMEKDFAWYANWHNEAAGDIIYWSSGSQCPEMLISGEVDMCSAWNGRIYDAAQTGAPLTICWECGFMTGTSGWNIAKHLKEQDPEAYELANLVVAWVSFPENNVKISQYITYGPVNSKSFPFMADPAYDAVRDQLPTSGANIEYSILWDEFWFSDNLDWAQEQFLAATQ